MRRIWYSVATSLDGFIAGPRGEYDWIPDEPDIDWGAFMARFDTVLMGRRSYEVAGSTPGSMPSMKTYVFSRTLRQEDHSDVTIVSDGEIDETIAALRRASGKGIWLFGGGELFRSLLARGHVDLVEVGLVPVLVGGGLPFLPPPATRTRLRLVDKNTYAKSGIMMLTYEVERGAG
ncbi:MAG: dihydrofolate reductase family protein [Gemmatimonadaceae bacterium]